MGSVFILSRQEIDILFRRNCLIACKREKNVQRFETSTITESNIYTISIRKLTSLEISIARNFFHVREKYPFLSGRPGRNRVLSFQTGKVSNFAEKDYCEEEDPCGGDRVGFRFVLSGLANRWKGAGVHALARIINPNRITAETRRRIFGWDWQLRRRAAPAFQLQP